jgi:hypothetical protein
MNYFSIQKEILQNSFNQKNFLSKRKVINLKLKFLLDAHQINFKKNCSLKNLNEESYIIYSKKKFLDNLKKKFEIINQSKKSIVIYFDNFVINLFFNKKPTTQKKKIANNIFFKDLQLSYRSPFFIDYFKNLVAKIFDNSLNILTYEKFLQINFFLKPNELTTRYQSFKLLTNNFNNLNVGQIYNFYKNKNNIIKQKKKIFFNKKLFLESLQSKIPIFFNVKYWFSSNNHYLQNLVNSIENKVPYEKQTFKLNNSHIISNKLINRNQNQNIKNFITKSSFADPLVIINNNIYSGRNRLLGAIKYLIDNNNFPIIYYKNYFNKNDSKIQILRIIFFVLIERFKFEKISISNYDSNYIEALYKLGISPIVKNFNNSISKNLILYKYNKISKKLKFVESNNFFSFIVICKNLMFHKNLKKQIFYFDKKNEIMIFEKKNLISFIYIVIKKLFSINIFLILYKK